MPSDDLIIRGKPPRFTVFDRVWFLGPAPGGNPWCPHRLAGVVLRAPTQTQRLHPEQYLYEVGAFVPGVPGVQTYYVRETGMDVNLREEHAPIDDEDFTKDGPVCDTPPAPVNDLAPYPRESIQRTGTVGCFKCGLFSGATAILTRYSASTAAAGITLPESLLWTCPCCGYSWQSRCADDPQDTAEAVRVTEAALVAALQACIPPPEDRRDAAADH